MALPFSSGCFFKSVLCGIRTHDFFNLKHRLNLIALNRIENVGRSYHVDSIDRLNVVYLIRLVFGGRLHIGV